MSSNIPDLPRIKSREGTHGVLHAWVHCKWIKQVQINNVTLASTALGGSNDHSVGESALLWRSPGQAPPSLQVLTNACVPRTSPGALVVWTLFQLTQTLWKTIVFVLEGATWDTSPFNGSKGRPTHSFHWIPDFCTKWQHQSWYSAWPHGKLCFLKFLKTNPSQLFSSFSVCVLWNHSEITNLIPVLLVFKF